MGGGSGAGWARVARAAGGTEGPPVLCGPGAELQAPWGAAVGGPSCPRLGEGEVDGDVYIENPQWTEGIPYAAHSQEFFYA